MADYKNVFVAHFETAPRQRGCATWGEKEFKTKWEAEKYLLEYRKSHWYARSSGWVETKTIDIRSNWQKAQDAIVERHVSHYIERMWSNWHGL